MHEGMPTSHCSATIAPFTGWSRPSESPTTIAGHSAAWTQ